MTFVTVTQAQGRVPVTVFELQDRLNMGNIGELEQAARKAYAEGVRDILIDLSNAPSLTSAGIRMIMIIHKMLAGPDERAKHLKLVCPTPYVREVLNIAGILEYIDIYDDYNKAVNSF